MALSGRTHPGARGYASGIGSRGGHACHEGAAANPFRASSSVVTVPDSKLSPATISPSATCAAKVRRKWVCLYRAMTARETRNTGFGGSKLNQSTAAGFTPGERDYIRRELDMFFSTYPTVADGVSSRLGAVDPRLGSRSSRRSPRVWLTEG